MNYNKMEIVMKNFKIVLIALILNASDVLPSEGSQTYLSMLASYAFSFVRPSSTKWYGTHGSPENYTKALKDMDRIHSLNSYKGNLSIRKFNPSTDFDEAARILSWDCNLSSGVSYLQDSWRKNILVYENNFGQIQGVCIFAGKNADVEYLAVSKDSQGLGIGKALLFEVMHTVKKDGADKIALNSLRNAVPFYERMGFKCDEDLHCEARLA